MNWSYFFLVSSIVSLIAGIFLKSLDTKPVNVKNLSPLQITYNLMLVYPFCVLLVWIQENFERWVY